MKYELFNMATESPSFLEKIGYLFYIVNPKDTSFEKPEDVPNYVLQVVPLFSVFIVLEACIGSLRGLKNFRINDGLGSISQGMIQQIMKTVTKGLTVIVYIYIYDNWRIMTLPWNSTWTWFLCFLCADLGYYVVHRAAHEINILWAAHQVHHSSEYYNLSTALRQSAFQDLFSWGFYLPMAFAIPPSLYIVHNQFNLLYQFWIHTELINTLGPLEYILNTPGHHRVHHGRNRYCIDKNYAGVLIIWDRMFGTFEPEEKKVVYGLTHPINTFEPLQLQYCHFLHIWRTFWSTEGFKNKLSVIFKGPGWEPGKPWHGCLEDIPDIHAPMDQYNPQIPTWCTIYGLIHFVLVIIAHIEVTERYSSFSSLAVLGAISYQIFSLTSLGLLFDGRAYAPWLELLRCLLFIFVDYFYLPVTRLMSVSNFVFRVILVMSLRICFLSSAFLWIVYYVKNISISIHADKKKVQ